MIYTSKELHANFGSSNRSCAYNASSAVLVLDKKAPGRGNLFFG
jgi:hypothetical protein